MDSLTEKIFAALKTNTLVFSSQIVADSFIYSYAREYKSAFKDRAVSWDKFRDSFTNRQKGFKKADSTDRRLFVELWKDFNKLKFYSNSSYQEALPAFRRSLASALPQLCRTCNEDGSIKQEFLDRSPNKDLVNDIKLTIPAYRAYLEDHKLYEPNLLTPNFTEAQDCVIVFPETFKDSDVLEAVKFCKAIETPKEDIFKGFEIYNNSVSEIRSVIRKIENLLKEGTKPYEIALTCADMEKYRPYISLEAKLRDIKIDFQDSDNLSVLPPGRFFKAFLNARKENWNFDSVRTLILDPMIPFKYSKIYPWIIQCAYKLKLKNGSLDRWEEKLKINAQNPDFRATEEDKTNNNLAYECFKVLAQSIENFELQRKTNCLSEAFMTFAKAVLEDKQWTSQDDNQNPEGKFAKVFGSCMDCLKKLEEKATENGISDQEIILDMYSDLLDSENYLDNLPQMGIKVYSYPLSAGLCIKNHFVLNLSEPKVKSPRDKFTILEDSTEDIGHGILACYLAGGAILSGSSDSFSGPTVIPTDFLEKGRSLEIRKTQDNFDTEKEVWDLKRENQTVLMSSSQNEGFEKTLEKIQGQKFVFENPLQIKKPFKMSISQIKEFEGCPYKVFADEVLNIKESLYEMDMEDAASIGNILHQTVQKAIKDSKSIGKIEIKRLREILSFYVYKVYQNRNDAPPKEYLDHIYKSFEEKLDKFVTEAEDLKDLAFDSMEEETKGSVVIDDVEYSGRADLVLRDQDGNFTVIDMKKNAKNYVKTKTLSQTSLQVAMYSKLLEENPRYNKTPTAGYYYSFQEGKYYRIWPQGGYYKNWEIDDIKADMKTRLTSINEKVADNDYEPVKNKDNCSSCPYKTLCRGGFKIR